MDWSPLRAPLDDDDVVLQSPTHHWLRSVPRAVHPVQLCRHYPRLGNRLALAWPDPRRTERLLMDLMIDSRGGRRGFAPRIATEIARLFAYNATRTGADKGAVLRGLQRLQTQIRGRVGTNRTVGAG